MQNDLHSIIPTIFHHLLPLLIKIFIPLNRYSKCQPQCGIDALMAQISITLIKDKESEITENCLYQRGYIPFL